MTGEPQASGPSRCRIAIRVAVWGLFCAWWVVLGGVVVAALAVRNGWQPERPRAAIESIAPVLLGHEVRIGRLTGGLRDGMVLGDVSVWPVGETPGRANVLRAHRIATRIDEGASLRRRELVLPELTIVGANIDLSRVDEDGWLLAGWGRLNDPHSTDPPTVLPIPVLVGRLELNAARLRLDEDVKSGLEHIAGRLDIGAGGLRLKDTGSIEWPIEASLRFVVTRAGWRGVDLGGGVLSGRLDGSRLHLERLELDGPVGHIVTTGQFVFAGPLNRPRARSGALNTAASGVDVNALARRGQAEVDADWTRIDGEVDLELRDRRLQGQSGFDLALSANVSPSTILGGRIEDASLSATYHTGIQRWWLHESHVDLAAGRVALSGTGVALSADRLDVAAPQVDLSRLPPQWRGDADVEGRADVELALHGPIANPLGTLTAQATALHVEGAGPSRLALSVSALGERSYRLDAFDWRFADDADRFAGTRLTATRPATLEIGDGYAVRDLALEWTGGALRVDGGLRDGTLLPSRIDLDQLDLAVAARLLGIDDEPGGVVTGRLDLSGDVQRPDLEAHLDWAAPRYRGLHADQIAVRIDGGPQHRSVSARMTRDGREALRVDVRLPRPLDFSDPRGWLGDPHWHVDLAADRFDLVWLSPLFADRGLEASGIVHGQLDARGSAQSPTAHGELITRDARLERSDAETTGELPVVGPVTGRVVFDGNTADTKNLQYGAGIDAFALAARLAWSGRLASDLDLDASVDGIGFKGRAILSAALRGEILEPTVLTFDDFDVAELARRARATAPVGGALTGELVVRGPIAEPDLRARLTWRDPQSGSIRADRLVVAAQTRPGSIDLDGRLEREGRDVLEATGSLSLDRRAPLSTWPRQLGGWPTDREARLALVADAFPLDWLALLAPGLPLKTDGRVSGEVVLSGADPVMSLDGSLALDRGVFSLATQTASVGPFSGTIRFEGQSAHFDRLLVSATRGGAVLAGRLHWTEDGVEEVSLRADFDGYRFDQLGLFRTNLDGSLVAEGPLDALRIGGALALGDIRIAFPSQQDPVLKEIRVLGLPESSRSTSIVEGEAEIAGIQSQTTVDVALGLPKGTWVRGLGLDAEIVGQIDVTKSPGGDLHYLGRLQVEYGRYTLQGKRFDLDSGVAVFSGGTSPIPDIDIQAHRQAGRDVEVFAQVSGPADQPTLELTSDPPMDKAEIISYLYFGRSATVGNRESQGAGAAAAGMAGGMLLDSVAPELRETLRIDEISVTSSEDDQTPAVEIETQITPDVYLRLTQSLGASADEAVEVRWRFWKGFNLQSRVTRSGTSAIDLLWEFDYWGLERYGLDGFDPPPPPYRTDEDADEDAEKENESAPCRPPLVCRPG